MSLTQKYLPRQDMGVQNRKGMVVDITHTSCNDNFHLSIRCHRKRATKTIVGMGKGGEGRTCDLIGVK